MLNSQYAGGVALRAVQTFQAIQSHHIIGYVYPITWGEIHVNDVE